jgi:hypothetical protein
VTARLEEKEKRIKEDFAIILIANIYYTEHGVMDFEFTYL